MTVETVRLGDSGLKPGEWRDLSEVEVEKLKKWKSGKVSIEVERGRDLAIEDADIPGV